METKTKNYTVKQVCDFSGVSPRTLHYYDQIDLLKPSRVAPNGYRYYDKNALIILQQILFFRELGLKLAKIKQILNQPSIDIKALLLTHQKNLQVERHRMDQLIKTIDHTVAYLNGEKTMKENEIYQGFDQAQQKEYEQEIADTYGADNPALKQSQQRWASYSKTQQSLIIKQGHQITQDIAAHIGIHSAEAPETQTDIARWHQHIHQNFYDCNLEMFASLGQLYSSDQRFRKNYQKVHPQLPEFLEKAMMHYCQQQK